MAQREIPRLDSPAPQRAQRSPLRGVSLRWSIGLSIVLSLFLTLLFSSLAAAEPLDSQTTTAETELVNVVFDSAELFSEEEVADLNSWAKVLLEDYGVAMAVEVVPTVAGRSIEEWTRDRANERRVGSAELNNGLFYGIALDDREFYVAKGDGYASIPDSELKAILDSRMIPHFKAGNFAQGIIDSSDSFGLLVTGAEPVPVEVLATPAMSQEALGTLDAVFKWTVGTIGVLLLGLGGFFSIRKLDRMKREKEAESARREALRVQQELNRLKAEAAEKRRGVLRRIPTSKWSVFAELASERQRHGWLLSNGVYEEAFGTPAGTMATAEEARLLDEEIGEIHFGGLRFVDGKTVIEARKDYEKLQEKRRREQKILEEKRRREDATRSEARQFWGGLSKSQRQQYSRLRSEQDRQRWVSDHGGAGIFGLNPAIAVAMLLSLSNDHTRAEQQAQRQAESHRTDYSNSSSTNYSSSNMFGGGSFDSGGGSGGSW